MTLDINGYGEKINGLSGSGIVDNMSATAANFIVGDADRDSTFSGVIKNTGGALSLEKVGAGTLTLSGANSFSGDTLVSAGTLALGSSNALAGSTLDTSGTGTVTFAAGANNLGGLTGNGSLNNGGNLLVVGANNQSTIYSGVLSGGGGLTKDGSGALTLSGTNTFSGAFTLNSGTVLVGKAGALGTGSLVLNSGTLAASGATEYTLAQATTIGGDFTLGQATVGTGALTLSGAMNLGSATRTITVANSGDTISGVISNGGLIKEGNGALTLSGNNTFFGGFTLNEGTIMVGHANALGANGNNVIINGGTLATSDNTARTLAQATAVGGDFTIGQASGGTGAITLSGEMNLGGTTRTITVDNTEDTISGAINNGGLTKAGNGTLRLTRNNFYNGVTLVNAGTLALAHTDAISASTLDTSGNGTVNFFAGTNHFGGLQGSGNINNGGNLFEIGFNNQNTVFSGVLSGNGGVTKYGSGALTLSGSNTFSGQFALLNGTILVGNDNALGSGNVVSFSNNATLASSSADAYTLAQTIQLWSTNLTLGQASGGTGALTFSGEVALLNGYNRQITVANDFDTISGRITSTGSLTKAGAGTLTLSGNNTYSGYTLVSQGILALGHTNALSGSTLDTSGAGTVSFFAGTNNIGGLKGGGNIDNGGHSLSIGANNESTIYSGMMSGTGRLTKVGSGELTLSGDNSFTGGFTLEAGTVLAAHDKALGANENAVTINGGTLASSSANAYTLAQATTVGGNFTIGKAAGGTGAITLSGAMNLGNATRTITVANSEDTISGTISGSGGLIKAGAGKLTLSGNNLLAGITRVNLGTLALENENALAGSTLDTGGGGTVIFRKGLSPQGNNNIGGLTGNGTLETGDDADLRANLTVGSNNNSTTYSGVMSGTGGLTKVGNGTLTLSGNNTFTGGTRAEQGTLALASESALAGSTLDTDGGGAVLFRSGTNRIGGLAGNGTLETGEGAGTASLIVGGNNKRSDYYGVMSGEGGLNKVGSGILMLSGNNTFTGDTVVESGQLQLSSENALAQSTLHISGLNMVVFREGTNNIGGLAGNGTIDLGFGILANLVVGANNRDTTYSGSMVNNGALTKTGTGTLTLSGPNNYSGDTLVSEGTLKIGANNAVPSFGNVTVNGILDLDTFSLFVGGLSGNGTVDKAGAGFSTLWVGDRDQTSTFAGVIKNTSGNLALLKTGNGILTLGGNNTYSGETMVSQGKLVINGSTAAGSTVTVASGATLGGSGTVGGNTIISGTHTPGNSPGLQTFESNLTYENGSTVVWELNSNTIAGRGTNFDGITVDGDLTINSTTTLNLVFNGSGSTVDWSNDLWATDQEWLFFNVGGTTVGALTMGVISADKNGILLAAVRPNASFSTTTSGNDILVSYNAIPEPQTWALLATSLTVAVIFRRRKR